MAGFKSAITKRINKYRGNLDKNSGNAIRVDDNRHETRRGDRLVTPAPTGRFRNYIVNNPKNWAEDK